MSQTVIKDGSTGNTAKVNPVGRLETLSVTLSHIGHESIDDEVAFVLSSDFITLTNTASENAFFYMKNTDSLSRFFVIETIRICSTGNGTMKVRYQYNPTGGTIISDAVAGGKVNLNIGSATEADIDVFTGGDSKTAIGGTNLTQYINKSPGHSIQEYHGALVVGKAQSFVVLVQPSVTTEICIEVVGYFETLND